RLNSRRSPLRRSWRSSRRSSRSSRRSSRSSRLSSILSNLFLIGDAWAGIAASDVTITAPQIRADFIALSLLHRGPGGNNQPATTADRGNGGPGMCLNDVKNLWRLEQLDVDDVVFR